MSMRGGATRGGPHFALAKRTNLIDNTAKEHEEDPVISFEFMPKDRADELLPAIFEILYMNMNEIAPSGLGCVADYAEWFSNVAPAIKKPQRQIILIFSDMEIVGYFQYYVNETTFMMEEIQLKREFWGNGVFRSLYAFLHGVIPEVPYVEAYAHRSNSHSRAILAHLGLKETDRSTPNHLHFRGSCSEMFRIMLGENIE